MHLLAAVRLCEAESLGGVVELDASGGHRITSLLQSSWRPTAAPAPPSPPACTVAVVPGAGGVQHTGAARPRHRWDRSCREGSR
ncbi:hypothetical protein FM125_02645 [Micrococcus lylae]|uniref:Uncharacterized protein n=1 Tax=Micrococcus lylae TaxID=1273 RepID=A0A1R4IIS6_9MICC|nr:hypothetical protein FM125_02645 [Micrococcus lylae]